MSFRLGLTGSIGMGKSTTAQLFAAEGIPVWDADATVHYLYSAGEPAALAVAELFPLAINVDGSVNRAHLRALIAKDPALLDRLNAAVHPLVAANRALFLKAHAEAPVVLLDIPLLYETCAQTQVDAVVVVSAPPEVQRDRVLARGMTETEFRAILGRQMPNSEKRALARWVIETTTVEAARDAVRRILTEIKESPRHA